MSVAVLYLVQTISWLITVYIAILFIRMVLDWIRFFARDFRPRGIFLVAANAVYALTDPPLRFLGRFVPVARIGNVGLDVGFMVLVIGLWIVRRLVWMLAFRLLL